MEWLKWVDVGLKAIGGFAILATMTPNKSVNAIGDIIFKVINVFAMNFGKATNEEEI